MSKMATISFALFFASGSTLAVAQGAGSAGNVTRGGGSAPNISDRANTNAQIPPDQSAARSNAALPECGMAAESDTTTGNKQPCDPRNVNSKR